MKQKMYMSFEQYELTLALENKRHRLAKLNIGIIKNLERFIKRNKSLVHLDLSNTNLTELMLWRIGSALCRAKSLVSIHFTNCQGITPALKRQLFKRTHSRKAIEKKLRSDEMFEVTDEYHTMTMQERANVLNSEKFFKENMAIRQESKQAFVNPNPANKLPTDGDHQLIFERQLGHKDDIPGSGQWRQLTKPSQKCWICANYIYTLVFWTKAQGWSDEDQIEPQVEDALIRQIEDTNDQFVDDDANDAVYFCEATGWKPKKLIKIQDFFFMTR